MADNLPNPQDDAERVSLFLLLLIDYHFHISIDSSQATGKTTDC